MPSITNTRRNGNVVTSELVHEVGIEERIFTFPDTTIRETLETSNESGKNLIVSVGKQVYVIINAFQSQNFTQSFTDFKMKAQTGHSSFRVKASYYESDQQDDSALSAQLVETVTKIGTQASFKGRKPRTLISFVTDDASIEDYTIFKDIIYTDRNVTQAKNVNSFKGLTPITINPVNEKTVTTISGGFADAGLPALVAGVLSTYRMSASENGYNYQTYRKYGLNEIWSRWALTDTTRSVWAKFTLA
ncbi:hypothetical protein [Peribacillus frigoritolerans]|uniref:hypothetical protein n=1 Tax=Peribacillus castrilensis TaxID=2897690 RepID=UPI003DA67606